MGRPRLAKLPKSEAGESEEISQEVPGADDPAIGDITKAEAIRRTLAEGITSARDGVDHIKKIFGLDVTNSHFAASKSREMEKVPAEPAPKRGRPLGKTDQEVEKTAPAPGSTAMTKADVCRAALAEGIETAEDAIDFARSTYGVDIKPTDFALYKSKGKKVDAPKAKPGRKARVAQLEQVVKTIQPAVGESVISDLAAVKALVTKLGVEEVIEIARLFS